MTMAPIHVCFSSDEAYAQHLAVAIASILHHRAQEDELVFSVLDGGISEENRRAIAAMTAAGEASIRFLHVDSAIFENAPIQTVQGGVSHVTLATYYRLLLPSLLPGVGRIIYLDCDLVCRASLAPLFSVDMQGSWVMGVEDIDVARHTERLGLERYVCAGVLLLDLAAWRRNGVEKLCLDFIRDHRDRIVLHDQDVLNVVCQEHLSYLERTWDAQACNTRQGNVSGFNALAKTANIVHFIGGRKPWHPGCRHPFRREYFCYLRMTPYRDFQSRFFWMRVKHFLWHTRYSHSRRRWYVCGIRVWQK